MSLKINLSRNLSFFRYSKSKSSGKNSRNYKLIKDIYKNQHLCTWISCCQGAGNILPILTNKKGYVLLVVKCATCRKKIWKYQKIGQGEVLRCHKSRITRNFGFKAEGDKFFCNCGSKIGIDKGTFYKMIPKTFTYSGSKTNK